MRQASERPPRTSDARPSRPARCALSVAAVTTEPAPTPPADGDLGPILRRALERCLAVGPDAEVLVLADRSRAELAERFAAEGSALGARATVAVAGLRDRFEPPAPVAAAMAACDVFVALTEHSISHTAAREAACAAGARGVGIGGGADADVLARLLGADLNAVAARSDRLAELLSRASVARIACPRGTDLQLDLRGRAGISDDGDFTARGAYGNLPFGEGFVSPIGGTGRLRPVTVAGMGRVGEDTALEVRDGALAAAEGADGRRLEAELREHGAAGVNLAELGIGTNDRARLSGSVVEDEKILGSVHIAFGASLNIGGTVRAAKHVDCVVPDATVLLDGEPVLRDGRLVPAA